MAFFCFDITCVNYFRRCQSCRACATFCRPRVITCGSAVVSVGCKSLYCCDRKCTVVCSRSQYCRDFVLLHLYFMALMSRSRLTKCRNGNKKSAIAHAAFWVFGKKFEMSLNFLSNQWPKPCMVSSWLFWSSIAYGWSLLNPDSFPWDLLRRRCLSSPIKRCLCRKRSYVAFNQLLALSSAWPKCNLCPDAELPANKSVRLLVIRR